jgi:uncharacterized protein (UPF0548 family)
VFIPGHPGAEVLEGILEQQSSASPTYTEVGTTGGTAPPGYRSDRRTARLGRGEQTYLRAVQGLRRWAPHHGAGIRLCPDNPDLEVGVTVVQAIGFPGFTVIAACRIVSVVEEADTFGFAYRTLPAHPEQGEESFTVSTDADGAVDFVICAFSRPRHPLARLGAPVSRRIQVGVTGRYLEGMRGAVG